MNLGQLEVLIAIVDSGSLTEAAEVVGLTQSAVSYSLSKLEAELGVTLLERGRQGVTVTRIGEDVLQHARNVLNQMEIIRQKTAHERGLSVGKLRFGTVPNLPPRFLTSVLRDFQHKYPDIEVVLFEGNALELVDWLQHGIIDIGTVLNPQDFKVSMPLARAEIKAIVHPDHDLATHDSIPFDALIAEPMVGPRAEYTNFRHLVDEQNLRLPRLRYEVSARSTIFAMVREKMGVAIMPEMMIDSSADDLSIHSLIPPLHLQVFLAANTVSPAIDAFLHNTRQWAKDHAFTRHTAS